MIGGIEVDFTKYTDQLLKANYVFCFSYIVCIFVVILCIPIFHLWSNKVSFYTKYAKYSTTCE